jgi:hypothetical protein
MAARPAPDAPLLEIRTLEGLMTAFPTDWIVRGVKGEFYPCKPDIFAATYEPVEQTRERAQESGAMDPKPGEVWTEPEGSSWSVVGRDGDTVKLSGPGPCRGYAVTTIAEMQGWTRTREARSRASASR